MVDIVASGSGHNILIKELLGGMERTAQLSRPQHHFSYGFTGGGGRRTKNDLAK